MNGTEERSVPEQQFVQEKSKEKGNNTETCTARRWTLFPHYGSNEDHALHVTRRTAAPHAAVAVARARTANLAGRRISDLLRHRTAAPKSRASLPL